MQHENIQRHEEKHVRIVQHEVQEQRRRHIIRVQQVVVHVQHEHIIQQHDEHVTVVQHEVTVHDEQRKQPVQTAIQVRNEQQQ